MDSYNVIIILKSNRDLVHGKLISVSPSHVPGEEWMRVDTGGEVHTVYRTDTLKYLFVDPLHINTITYNNGDEIGYVNVGGRMVVVRVTTHDKLEWVLGEGLLKKKSSSWIPTPRVVEASAFAR